MFAVVSVLIHTPVLSSESCPDGYTEKPPLNLVEPSKYFCFNGKWESFPSDLHIIEAGEEPPMSCYISTYDRRERCFNECKHMSYLIRSGANVSFGCGARWVYVESGATLHSGGGKYTAFIENGATVEHRGGLWTKFYEDGAQCCLASTRLTTATTTATQQHTVTSTSSITTSTTMRLQVNDECSPLNDICDKAKKLVCSMEVYKCRYGTTTTAIVAAVSTADSTVTTTTAITATTALAEESGQEEMSNVGGIAGGAVGVAGFLTIFGVLMYRCGRKKVLEEVRRRAPPPGARNQRRGVPQKAYGEATTQNPTFDDSPAPAYAEVDEEPAYVTAVPGRATIYDQGHLAGAGDHALRDKRLSQQLANSYA